nr:ankyrin repeat-containing protein At3g12360-like isoform X1 [Ipomoea batatas]
MLKSSEDLEVKNAYGYTAFYYAVVSGVVENVKCMIEKNNRLPSIRSYTELTPIHQAALQRHVEMVSYLRTVTPLECLERHERITLLKITIYNHMHVRKQGLAPTGGGKQEAGIWQRFLGSTSALFSTRFLNNGIEEEFVLAPRTKEASKELLGIIWEEHQKLSDYKFRELITREYEILHYAAKEGNVEFLDMILESKPDLFCGRNKSGQTILHVAVLYRQQNVVSYICNKQGYKDIMTLLLDYNNNNILHLAAKAGNTLLCKSQDEADDHQWIDEEVQEVREVQEEMEEVPKNKKKVNHDEKNMTQQLLAVWSSKAAQKEVVPENKKKDEKNIMQESSALQISTAAQMEVVPENKKKDDQEEEKNIMQESSALGLSTAALHYEREISWFMGVEKIVPSSFHHMRNKDGKTPKQLFLKEHMKLKMNAEKSIRGTADSCMIVATLIATVAFSAAFTAPGGNDGQTGIPIFIKRASFTVFTISDAVAMIFSMVSILTFLSILIWRNKDDDFHLALKRLFVGFAAMGVSICGMLFAFTAAFFLVYGRAWQPILIAAFVALPIASFLYLNTRLWIDVVGSMLLKLLPFTKQTTYVGGWSRPKAN